MSNKFVAINNDNLLITYRLGKSDKAIVVFQSLIIEEFKEEFWNYVPDDCTGIFVFNKKKDWGNSFDEDELVDVIKSICPGKQIYTMGGSMGGFLSIAFASKLGAKKCLAFSPQYSVCPDIIKDHSYMDYVKNISTWKIPHLTFDDSIPYHIFSSTIEEDLTHNKLIKENINENVNFMILQGPRFSHGIAYDLRDAGFLSDIISAWINDPDKIKEIYNLIINDPEYPYFGLPKN